MPQSFPLTPQGLSIRRKVVLGFGFVLAMLATIAFITLKSTRAFQNTAELVAESRETLEIGEQLMRRIMEMESARRGFLITGDERVLSDEYEPAQLQVAYAFDTLKRMTAKDPAQSVRVDRLKLLLARIVAAAAEEIEARQTGGAEAAEALFAQGKTEAMMAEVREVAFDFEHAERVQLAERSELTQSVGHATTFVTVIGTSITLLALGSAGFFIMRDIGRRVRAEEALAEQAILLTNIMDAMPEHVFVKDKKGRYIAHNRAHRLYMALRLGESIEGRTVFDIFPQELAERYHADDVYVLETGAPIRDREEPARPASPNIVWLSTTKMPLRDPSGRVIGVVCVSTDITARKAADEKLKRFAEQLERSNAELNSFASVASHDLQEPLRKIQAFGDRLRAKCGEELGEQGLDYLHRMQNAAERMQVLIQDLLKLSRVSSRAKPFEPCALGRVVEEVLSDLEVAIEDTKARVQVGELTLIDADPLQMRQLFQNLIANALKFHKPGDPPVIEISSEVLIAEGHEIPGGPRGSELCRVTVRDEGIGFDQKFADQIFVVFQRLHTRHEYEGTGIGLAVCRKITDRHAGSIVAKSAEGQGATFIVTLPAKQPTPTAHE
jgi:PAS domain S-box-containing protein